MRLYKRNGVYYVEYRDDAGRRHRDSTRCTTLKAAQKHGAALELRAQAGASPKAQAITLEHALTSWLDNNVSIAPRTRQGYDLQARHLAEFMGDELIHTLNRARVREYLTARTKEGASSVTLHKELVTLRQALTYAFEAGWTSKLAAEVIPPWKSGYKPKTRWLTPDEVARVVGEMDKSRRLTVQGRQLWIWMGVYTGGRYGELSRIEWSDVDLEAGRIHIRGTKTAGSDRWVGIPQKLQQLLRSVPPPHQGPVLKPWLSCTAGRTLGRICKALGIPRFTLHDLRRTFGSWLTQEDVGAKKVARLMGHSSTQMLDRVYARLDQSHLDEATQRLDRQTSSPTTLSDPDDAIEP